MIAHKKARTVHLGEHVTLIFEDELTIRYQVQEMLRIEKIFEEEGIQDELEALITRSCRTAATSRRRCCSSTRTPTSARHALGRLKGIEDRRLHPGRGLRAGCSRSPTKTSTCRENDEKTSSVHFLRFELTPEMKAALKYGVGLGIGVDHPNYQAAISAVGDATRCASSRDLQQQTASAAGQSVAEVLVLEREVGDRFAHPRDGALSSFVALGAGHAHRVALGSTPPAP